MELFKKLVKMSQKEMKVYVTEQLKKNGYDPVVEDGFVYAKGNIPVMLTAHMDTVHKQKVTQISECKGVISSPQGIGGDDRCGIWTILTTIQCGLKPYVLFNEDEEIGCVGARKFTKSEICNDLKDKLNYIVEIDRRGAKDAVFYQCDNEEFTEWILNATGYDLAYGSCSDISVIAPALNAAAVNLSSGYYNEHTLKESVVFEDMKRTRDTVKNLLLIDIEQRFEYREKERYSFGNYYSTGGSLYSFGYGNGNNYGSNTKTTYTYSKSAWERAMDDTKLKLEVVFIDIDDEEQIDVVEGLTKPEAWFNFFISHPDICFDVVTDYCWL